MRPFLQPRNALNGLAALLAPLQHQRFAGYRDLSAATAMMPTASPNHRSRCHFSSHHDAKYVSVSNAAQITAMRTISTTFFGGTKKEFVTQWWNNNSHHFLSEAVDIFTDQKLGDKNDDEAFMKKCSD